MAPSISSYESGGILDSKATVSFWGQRAWRARRACDAHDHLVDGVSQMAVSGQLAAEVRHGDDRLMRNAIVAASVCIVRAATKPRQTRRSPERVKGLILFGRGAKSSCWKCMACTRAANAKETVLRGRWR